jgi:hypothetical protein
MKIEISKPATNGLVLHPIADTIVGSKAVASPAAVISHYENLANRLWPPPALIQFAENHLRLISEGRTAWGSIAAPYGFGKTAAAVCLWQYARRSGFLAIPPLSCTSLDELAAAIDSLAEVQMPELKNSLRRLRTELWREELDEMARSDSERYTLPRATVRRLLRDKAQSGRLAVEGSSHRFVEFLSRLGELSARHCKGLLVIVDELQQLLGPLDAITINRFREFVWGMRTERSRCGVVLAIDALLEARLARWAEDILHRIRETGPTFQLAEVYTREFPKWLWSKVTSVNGAGSPQIHPHALADDVLVALGQLVERPDLANGPRTVVDVFQRACEHFTATGVRYEILHLIDDVRNGRFRYFGEGYPIQITVGRLLADEWIARDALRSSLVKTLAAFPLGCPKDILQRSISNPKKLDKTVSDLFSPLLVRLSGGLALEALQQVRRPVTNWEQIIRQCWERLPALDTLVAHAPQFILRTLVPRLFARGNPADPQWELISDEASAALTGWRRYRGSFDPSFPSREIALSVSANEPSSWLDDADVSFAMVCEGGAAETAQPSMKVEDGGRRVVLRLPVLRALQAAVPAEIRRYSKFIQPEPFRPAMILAALHDLQSRTDPEQELNAQRINGEHSSSIRELETFLEVASDYLIHSLLEGSVDVGHKQPITLRGPALLRAVFSVACRNAFSDYQTLKRAPKWLDIIRLYCEALRSQHLTLPQRQGREAVRRPKGELYQMLFRQKSTAAGDSVIRSLGPLVTSSGDSKEFTLSLVPHPGEKALLQYLRQSGRAHSVPEKAAVEFLRHRGYLDEETRALIEILSARDAITIDRQRGIALLRDDANLRKSLSQRIETLREELLTLGANVPIQSPETTISALSREIDELQTCVENRVEELATDVQMGADEITALIGKVRAGRLPTDWLATELSTHLRGVCGLLSRNQEDLLRGLRKELKRVNVEIERIAPRTPKTAVVWQVRRAAFRAGWEKLRQRATQLDDRIRALSQWKAPNSQLHATRALCTKLSEHEPAPSQTLDLLIIEYRERFAVDQWKPLFDSAEFKERLGTVQTQLQILLFRQLQLFVRERDTLLREFGHLLPKDPPDFEARDGQTFEAMDNSFQGLYRWTCDHLRTALKKSRMRHKSGVPWRDPSSGKSSWRQINQKVEQLLSALRPRADHKTVQQLGTMIERIRAGFRFQLSSTVNYDDPKQPPDFLELAELYARGSVSIRVASVAK